MIRHASVLQIVGADFAASSRSRIHHSRLLIFCPLLNLPCERFTSRHSIHYLIPTVDEHFEAGGFVTETNSTGNLVLILSAFAVTALERFFQIALSHFGAPTNELTHHHDSITRVLNTATISRHALHAMSASFALEQIGSFQITRKERPFAGPDFLNLNPEIVVRDIDQIRIEELFSKQLRVKATFPRYDFNQNAPNIKDAPTK